VGDIVVDMAQQLTACHPLAGRFWQAMTSFDEAGLAALLAPDAKRWVNVLGVEADRGGILAAARAERTLLAEPVFQLRRSAGTGDGFVLVFDLTATCDGTPMAATVCLLATARDGYIQRMDEFVDGQQVIPLMRALLRRREPTG
jgi:ketosteroid isomerase-like protein